MTILAATVAFVSVGRGTTHMAMTSAFAMAVRCRYPTPQATASMATRIVHLSLETQRGILVGRETIAEAVRARLELAKLATAICVTSEPATGAARVSICGSTAMYCACT